MKKLLIALSWVVTINDQIKCQQPSTSNWVLPKSYNCNNVSSLYPHGNTNVSINVNFVFPKPTSASGVYDNITTADCQRMLDSLNYYLSHLKPPTFPLPWPHTAPIVTSAKIHLILKSIIRPANDNVYNNGTPFFIYNTDAFALNIMRIRHGSGGNGAAPFAISNELVIQDGPITSPPILFGREDLHLLLHEIGHCLGLEHTEYITNTTVISGLNPNGTILPNYHGVKDYWLEDINTFNKNPSPNNIMSYNWFERDYLSPQQIAYIHYLLKVDPLLKKVVNNYGFYSSTGDCYVDPNYDITISPNTNVTWSTAQNPQGNIIVEAGAHLAIMGCVSMTKGSKIIVKQGARLTVLNGEITGKACGQWKGIEVWGTGGGNTAPLNSSGMPSSFGMVHLENAVIADAEIGVRLGKPNASGNATNNFGGGLITSLRTKYLNNKVSVKFDPCFGPGYGYNNSATFKLDTFIVDDQYLGSTPPKAAIDLNSVMSVDILGCYFRDVNYFTSYGIKCINSFVQIKDYCSGSTMNGFCAGNTTSNQFFGFDYGIYISTSNVNNPSVIDHVTFMQSNFPQNSTYPTNTLPKSTGGIYIGNNLGTQVTNCSFYNNYNSKAPSVIVYGLYLDNCTGYVVENNYFEGKSPTVFNAGIFVNNSGGATNGIYNNTFNKETQGIWTQNENYYAPWGSGLTMNCNDFTNSQYNIGVQSTFLGATCSGCPLPTQDAGVSTTQGIANTANDMDKVRNTYQTTSCNNNAENKYYVNTNNAFVISSHGSFPGSQFHPTPQTNNSCSNTNEITVIFGNNQAPSQKSAYCPNNYMPSYSNRTLIDDATNNRFKIITLNAAYIEALDGGNTQGLLDVVYGNTSAENVRDELFNKTFLSDTVLKSYFNLSGVNHTYLLDVFTKNAPLHPRVWSSVSNIGLSEAEQVVWDGIQFQNKLSPRAEIEANRTLAYNQLGYVNNEKIRRFLADTLGVQYDSLIGIYNLNEIPNSKFKKVDVYIAAGNISAALSQLDELEQESESNSHFCTLLHHVINLSTDTTHAAAMLNNTDTYNYLLDVANSNNALVEGYAKALLTQVYDYKYDEVKLEPEETEGSGERLANSNSNQEQIAEGEIELIKGVRLFPNPASNELNLEIENGLENIRLQITDVTGKVVINQTCTNSCQLNISTLQNGLYLVNLYRQDNLLGVKKIVVIK